MTRRPPTLKQRCFQLLATAVVVWCALALIGVGADWVARLVGR